MPYLALDGWTIPVRPGDTEMPLEIGTRSRMFSGALLRTARALKRQWGFQTTPMKREDYTALVGLLLGRGDLWTYDADLYSEKGVGPDAGSVTTSRPGAGADGAASPSDAKFTGTGKGSIAVDDDTTNLSSIRDVESTTGWTVAGAASVANTTTHKYIGAGCITVATTGVVGDTAKATLKTDAVASTTYTMSCYLKRTAGASGLAIRMIALDNGVDVGDVLPTTITAQWVRAVKTFTTSAAGGAHTIEIMLAQVEDNGAATVAVDAIQLEQAAFATSFRSLTTARGTGALKYTTAFLSKATQGWTLSFWTPGQSSSTAPSPGGVLDVTNSAASLTTNRFEVRIDPAIPNLAVFLYGSDGVTSATLTQSLVSLGTWRMWTIVVRTNAPTGLFGLEIYRDGTRVNQSSPAAAAIPDVTAFAKVAVGMRASGVTRLNAPLDELRLLPYPASPDQVTGWFNAAVQLPGPPRVRMTGVALHEPSLTVEGEVLGQAATEVAFAGTYVPEAKQVDFALHEV